MSIVEQVRRWYAEPYRDRSSLFDCLLAEKPTVEGLVEEVIAACTTTMEVRAALVQVLATFIPYYGWGHAAVDAAFRILAASETYRMDRRDLQAPAVLEYPLIAHVVATPALPLAPESLILLNDAHDLERGVLLLSESTLAQLPHLAARYPYLPVQAIPSGSRSPDLVVEIWDGTDLLTTLEYCTIWRGMQRSTDLATWRRVSYPRPQLAMIYNEERLALCPYCLYLHRSTCLVSSPLKRAEMSELVSP